LPVLHFGGAHGIKALHVLSNQNHSGGIKFLMATSKKASGKQSSKRMSQAEVLNHFAQKFDIKRAQVKEFFEELATLAGSEVKRNGEFQLPGFGKLVKAERKAREGRNPATGETIQIPAKTTLKFRIGKGMKDTVLPAKKK
jgi:DNA-binding protein HU-beta